VSIYVFGGIYFVGCDLLPPITCMEAVLFPMTTYEVNLL
jgi:hypothetical protein